MPHHKYKVGQAVGFRPGRWGFPAPPGEYKILRLLPVEGHDLMYRIKCAAETFERVAKESELAPRSKPF
jgi:hypothetical protein